MNIDKVSSYRTSPSENWIAKIESAILHLWVTDTHTHNLLWTDVVHETVTCRQRTAAIKFKFHERCSTTLSKWNVNKMAFRREIQLCMNLGKKSIAVFCYAIGIDSSQFLPSFFFFSFWFFFWRRNVCNIIYHSQAQMPAEYVLCVGKANANGIRKKWTVLIGGIYKMIDTMRFSSTISPVRIIIIRHGKAECRANDSRLLFFCGLCAWYADDCQKCYPWANDCVPTSCQAKNSANVV